MRTGAVRTRCAFFCICLSTFDAADVSLHAGHPRGSVNVPFESAETVLTQKNRAGIEVEKSGDYVQHPANGESGENEKVRLLLYFPTSGRRRD